MNRAIIGVGSNIDPETHINRATEALTQLFGNVRSSTIRQTRPVGFTDQPDFFNGAISIETTDSCESVGRALKQIESDLGRIRTENKHGPRTIDLDIVVWNGKVVDHDFYSRDFLRDAVLELEPDMGQVRPE